jgi:hypothetical protein
VGVPANVTWTSPPRLIACTLLPGPRYVLRRQEQLAEGFDPADLSVFGAALTRGLSPSKRMTNAAVAVCVFLIFIKSPELPN